MKKLLPSYFKLIGVALIIISIVILIINYSFKDLFTMDQNIFKWIFKDLILLGAIFISFSYQKNETSQITEMRFGKFANALLFGTMLFFLDTIMELIFNSGEFELKSAYEILLTILIYFIIVFHHDLYKMKETNQ
ncbi:hypothetical protein [Christiangramia forsetii]|uniref:Membrane protein n=2 Tax=Christiangramia forsetii TaxID=411153 RepID=A0M735_CHRFK|nr:hypothetical protein [Christiangramia forsetii]GGG28809.1 hypothetical protein GCM10011532_10340 [Christiangramia forsetii]CAL68430.1 membrane protein [Christiangramia forsetii KT0803]